MDNYLSSFQHCISAVERGSCAAVGSPVQFKVIDVNKVIVRGDGLGLVPVNRPATFTITAPDAKLSEIDVAITSTFNSHLLYYCFMSAVIQVNKL